MAQDLDTASGLERARQHKHEQEQRAILRKLVLQNRKRNEQYAEDIDRLARAQDAA